MLESAVIKYLENQWYMDLGSQSVQSLSTPWCLPVTDVLSELKVVSGLTHLTTMEADLAMLHWFDKLAIGGVISITVPNAEYFMKLWLAADWNAQTIIDPKSDARTAFRYLWGEQKNGNPRDQHYDQNHKDVHKSAYTENRLICLVKRAGFVNIRTRIDDETRLTVIADKTMHRGERQIATDHTEVRPDHINRYEFACQQLVGLGANAKVLDLACGIGYGSKMLAQTTGASVTAVDIDKQAIAHAKKHFSHSDVEFINQDAKRLVLESNSFDAVVSFETIEHIDFVNLLFDKIYAALRPGGIFICSTPNQEIMPFDIEKFPFHVKHFYNSEVLELLDSHGFKSPLLFAQHDPVNGKVIAGEDGCFSIFVAKK